MKKLLIFSIILLVLAGCTNTNPYTGETQATKKTKYGAGGAVTGAVIGQVVGKNTKSTAIGAAIGTAVGVGYGAYLDKQESELREQLGNSGVSVQKNGEELNLIMPGNITFDTDSYAIKGNFYEVLNSINLVLKKYNKTMLVVSGHTDITGKYDYNKTLSFKRAESVAKYFVNNGVDGNRIAIYGYGPDYPVASNDTVDGRAQNRRVELKISKMENVEY